MRDLAGRMECRRDLASLEEDSKVDEFCGYFLDRYPFFYLYDSQENYRSNNFEHAVTVRYSNCLIASGAQGIEVLNGELVKVRGSFHKDSFETQGLAHGRLDGVEGIDSPSVSISCDNNEMKVHHHQAHG